MQNKCQPVHAPAPKLYYSHADWDADIQPPLHLQLMVDTRGKCAALVAAGGLGLVVDVAVGSSSNIFNESKSTRWSRSRARTTMKFGNFGILSELIFRICHA